jgi:hypothetical protein
VLRSQWRISVDSLKITSGISSASWATISSRGVLCTEVLVPYIWLFVRSLELAVLITRRAGCRDRYGAEVKNGWIAFMAPFLQY